MMAGGWWLVGDDWCVDDITEEGKVCSSSKGSVDDIFFFLLLNVFY